MILIILYDLSVIPEISIIAISRFEVYKAPFNIINMLIEMLRQELGDNQEQRIYEIMNMIVSKATQTRVMIERLFGHIRRFQNPDL